MTLTTTKKRKGQQIDQWTKVPAQAGSGTVVLSRVPQSMAAPSPGLD